MRVCHTGFEVFFPASQALYPSANPARPDPPDGVSLVAEEFTAIVRQTIVEQGISEVYIADQTLVHLMVVVYLGANNDLTFVSGLLRVFASHDD